MEPKPWQKNARKTVIDSKFLKVHFDEVTLSSGVTIDDYSVVTLPSGVVVVATDEDGRLVTQYEYKYAIDKVILNLPSGSVEGGKSPLEMAAIELKEETGYMSDDMELVGTLYEYPSKLDHVIHIVRAKNAKKVSDVQHETTESIGPVHLLSADDARGKSVFNTTYAVSALALTLPEFL